MTKIDWENIFKVRIANPDESFQKHEVIKLLLVTKLLGKYKSQRQWIRIYTEQYLPNGLKADVYFENTKTKEVICYEVQKEITKEWLKKTAEQYNNYEVPFFNTVDLVIIPLKEAPNDITKLNKWLNQYVQ